MEKVKQNEKAEELLSTVRKREKPLVGVGGDTEVKNWSDEEFKALGMLTELGKIID